MTDVREKILSKYDINIDKVNVIKLYKIDSSDISLTDLEIKIEACHKKWNQSINGANEKFAERDRNHLEKADKYEQILRDKKLRKELFDYYNEGSSSNENMIFAKSYFKMISETKKIDKKDVDFFFKYYQNERKNKKYVLEMLKKDFKIHGLGKEDDFAIDDEKTDSKGKRKNESSPLITNLFQEATILKIHKCEQFFEKASKSIELKSKYSYLDEDLYSFLSIDKHKDLSTFVEEIGKKRDEAANYRLDRGQEYTPIVDLFNTIFELTTYSDVVDNFSEFKLLIKYPKLSPYMYLFSEVKSDTLKEFYSIAEQEYLFRSLYDFVLSYFKPIYDNFGILDKGLGLILKKAEQKAKTNKVLNVVDDILGLNKRKKLPFGVSIMHYAVYFPIYFFYLVFEAFKTIILEMRRVAYLLFAILFIGLNWLAGDGGLLQLRYIFNKDKWLLVINAAENDVGNVFELILNSLAFILLTLMIFILPPLLVSMFLYRFSEYFSQSVDWMGLERTFHGIFITLKNKTEKQYSDSKKLFYKKKMPLVLINIFCFLFLGALFYLVPLALEWLGAATGYSDFVLIQNFNNQTWI